MKEVGAIPVSNDEIKFTVWAPKADYMSVVLFKENKEVHWALKEEEFHYWSVVIPKPSGPTDYLFCLNGEKLFPDPASRFQPNGVHGPSRIYDPLSYAWRDQNWKGVPLKKYIIYELHVGTFTDEGTFAAVIQKLPYLKKLGVTAIELMPVMEFSGDRNWGYDVVFPYAPHHAYGGPDGLKRLIDECHIEGLAVILDVVYNHLGAEGNYGGNFGYYLSDRYKTPWGESLNFDGPYCDPVRHFVIGNALYFLNEFHVDALRIDAVQTIFDLSAKHVLQEIREEFYQQAKKLGREAYVIAESDLNDVRILNSIEKGGYAIDAQWNDDFHHALYALLTKSKRAYFSDFGKCADLAKAIKDGFVYEGQWSSYRKRKHGNSSKHISGERFVVCIQNHDQVGNAVRSERLDKELITAQIKIAALILLCSPNIPLIFMGEEWNASSPFLFFTSFENKELIEVVREGYRRDFHLEEKDFQKLDPQRLESFEKSKLRWDEIKNSEHFSIYQFYKDLIHLRKEYPCLSNCRKDLTHVFFNDQEEWLIMHRTDPLGSQALLTVNFSGTSKKVPINFPKGTWQLKQATHQIVLPKYELEGDKTIFLDLDGWQAVLYLS